MGRSFPHITKPVRDIKKWFPHITKPILDINPAISHITKPVLDIRQTILYITKPFPHITDPILDIKNPIPYITKRLPYITKPPRQCRSVQILASSLDTTVWFLDKYPPNRLWQPRLAGGDKPRRCCRLIFNHEIRKPRELGPSRRNKVKAELTLSILLPLLAKRGEGWGEEPK